MSRSPLFFTDLPDTSQQQIYEIGKSARDRQIESRWQRMQEMKRSAPLTEAEDIAGIGEEITQPEADEAGVFDEKTIQPEADAGEKLLDAADETADVETESGTADALDFADTDLKKTGYADSRDIFTKINIRGTTKIKQGFSAFSKGDVLYERIKAVEPDGDKFDVAMHGSPSAVAFGGKEANMSPRTLASIIRHSKDYHGQEIRLLSCNTGNAINGEYCFAEELANALGKVVHAPNDLIFISAKGKITIGKDGSGKFIPYAPNERARLK